MEVRWVCKRVPSPPEGLPNPQDALGAVRAIQREVYEAGVEMVVQPSLVPDPTHPGRFMVVSLAAMPQAPAQPSLTIDDIVMMG